MSRSSVLLPHPDGPIKEMNSPGLNGEVDVDQRVHLTGSCRG